MEAVAVEIKDWLAREIAGTYQVRFKDDPAYVASKTESLAALTRLEAMRAINDLDAKGRGDLCDRLAIPLDQLTVFLQVLKKL